ncbi:MAG: DNA-methyltransferase [Candidatus Kariarchaeaceae archaeon]|jgi:site-specific DNA-methyltransferase (adenine-specific)
MTNGTKTSDFGASKRENHDSSHFYASKLYEEIPSVSSKPSDGLENSFPKALVNKIIQGDSRDLSMIPDLSISLVITSPPYNSRKQYDDDLTLKQYLELLETVFTGLYPKLIDGARICLNLANMGRKPYIAISDHISHILNRIGYYQRGEIIWDKGSSAGSSTAWGSWKSASNPVLRDVHEYILVYSKGTLKRSKSDRESTISRDEFLEATKSVWNFSTVSAKKIGHPAPFPVELPYRCIQLYSYENDLVFDPFMGSGTTGIAAMKTGRRFFGLDINQEYVDLANDRIEAYKALNTS